MTLLATGTTGVVGIGTIVLGDVLRVDTVERLFSGISPCSGTNSSADRAITAPGIVSLYRRDHVSKCSVGNQVTTSNPCHGIKQSKVRRSLVNVTVQVSSSLHATYRQVFPKSS